MGLILSCVWIILGNVNNREMCLTGWFLQADRSRGAYSCTMQPGGREYSPLLSDLQAHTSKNYKRPIPKMHFGPQIPLSSLRRSFPASTLKHNGCNSLLLLPWALQTYFLCCAEERLVQMTATTTTTTTVMTPTVTTMMTRRLLFFWGVTLPWGGCICPMGGSARTTRRLVSSGFIPLPL